MNVLVLFIDPYSIRTKWFESLYWLLWCFVDLPMETLFMINGLTLTFGILITWFYEVFDESN